MNIGFFIRHFTERGTEVAAYDYAKYNEDILHNTSYIICFTEFAQKQIGFPLERASYDKFKSRFYEYWETKKSVQCIIANYMVIAIFISHNNHRPYCIKKTHTMRRFYMDYSCFFMTT